MENGTMVDGSWRLGVESEGGGIGDGKGERGKGE